MNLVHMRYAVEVAKFGSLSRAAESLFVALPNVSRAIKGLEDELGIKIFDRTVKGVTLTPDGEEFILYAQAILLQMSDLEKHYKSRLPKRRKFSVSVPRSCYVSEAFTRFSKTLGESGAELYYKETNSQRTLQKLLTGEYKLGVIRCAEQYEKYFKSFFEEKDLAYEVLVEFSYRLIMNRSHPLADREDIRYEDLAPYIEIIRGDPYVPTLPLPKVVREELAETTDHRIFVFERGSQFNLLAENPETFMWVSPVPQKELDRFGLVEKQCAENNKRYRDLLVWRNGYVFSELDQRFVSELRESIERNF